MHFKMHFLLAWTFLPYHNVEYLFALTVATRTVPNISLLSDQQMALYFDPKKRKKRNLSAIFEMLNARHFGKLAEICILRMIFFFFQSETGCCEGQIGWIWYPEYIRALSIPGCQCERDHQSFWIWYASFVQWHFTFVLGNSGQTGPQCGHGLPSGFRPEFRWTDLRHHWMGKECVW